MQLRYSVTNLIKNDNFLLIFGQKRDFLKSPLISSVEDQRPVQKVDGPIILKSCRDLEKITGRKIPIKKTYFTLY